MVATALAVNHTGAVKERDDRGKGDQRRKPMVDGNGFTMMVNMVMSKGERGRQRSSDRMSKDERKKQRSAEVQVRMTEQ